MQPAPWQQPQPQAAPWAASGQQPWIAQPQTQAPWSYGNTAPVQQCSQASGIRVGERVKCEAIPNTDGGKYSWRITRLEVEGTSHLAHTPVASSGAAHHTPAALTAAAGAGGHATAASAIHLTLLPCSKPHGRDGHAPASGPQAHQAPLGRPPPAMQGAQGGRWQGSNSDHGRAYNSAPPPTTAYVADVALAVAANAISSIKEPVGPPAADAATYGKSVALMTDSERKRAEVRTRAVARYRPVRDDSIPPIRTPRSKPPDAGWRPPCRRRRCSHTRHPSVSARPCWGRWGLEQKAAVGWARKNKESLPLSIQRALRARWD
ncbi:hypothetical protein V8C86DRAFT_3011077 [Haematococcus lacustris]